MSLLLAFSIWLIHNLSLNYSDTISVPVMAQCNIDGHSNVSSNSSMIAARCRIGLLTAEDPSPGEAQGVDNPF